MSDEAMAPEVGAGEPVTVITPAADTGTDLNIRQAAQALAAARHRQKEEPAPVEQPAADPVEPDELAQANADPAEEPIISEEPSEADPAELPPIDPPRSWTKEAKERFESLPRETQEYLAEREQDRDRELRRVQNEAAETRKAIQAEKEQAEQARKQYEEKLPALMETLQRQSQFSDIRTLDDVKKLQAEDPFRFQAWQVHQMDMQAVDSELKAAQARQQQETQTAWQAHVEEQNRLFAEKVPEFADKAKQQQMVSAAVEVLHDKGFTDQELADYASGKQKLSIYDHRLQQLILDGVKFRDVQKAKTAVVSKPLPPVQRPGVSRPAGAAASEQIQALTRKLEQSGSLKDAQALRAAQAAAASRRAQ